MALSHGCKKLARLLVVAEITHGPCSHIFPRVSSEHRWFRGPMEQERNQGEKAHTSGHVVVPGTRTSRWCSWRSDIGTTLGHGCQHPTSSPLPTVPLAE